MNNPKKIYRYNKNGKLVVIYESHKEALKKCFGKASKQPLFQYKSYYILKDKSVVTPTRLGRDTIKEIIKKVNNPYILHKNDTQVSINIYNLDGISIGTANSIKMASMFTGVSINTIHSQLFENKSKTIKNKQGLKFELL